MKSNKLTANIAIFAVLLIVLPALTLFLPKKTFSENENRYLQEFPVPTLKTLEDKSFMSAFEKFFSDHFVLREKWIQLKNQMEIITNKKEINGVYLTEKRLIEHQELNEDIIKQNTEAINSFAEKYKKPTFLMIVPTAESIYTDQLPLMAPYFDQKKVIDSIYTASNKNLTCIDVFTPLLSAKNQYIYYNTDHHWTSLGAYLGYFSSAKPLGFAHNEIDKFNVEHASHDFKGTLYSKTLYEKSTPDTIDLYHLSTGEPQVTVTVNSGQKSSEHQSIFFRNYLDKKDKYNTFLGQNEPCVSVKTDVTNQKKLLIIKDSYAHSMVQFYMYHYSEITLVDLRYVNKLSNYVSVDDYDQIMFVYNFASVNTDTSIGKKLPLF
ncbi:MAG: hypothetical protein KHW79_01580 [Clostridiales bacterium]|nr:hypothetical protein [Clostridiales bacterium]